MLMPLVHLCLPLSVLQASEQEHVQAIPAILIKCMREMNQQNVFVFFSHIEAGINTRLYSKSK